MEAAAKVVPAAIDIVHIDPKMTPEQEQEAILQLYESHGRAPITKPVSIQLSERGGFIFNEGSIVTMTPDQISERFTARLKADDPWAIRLNNILCEG